MLACNAVPRSAAGRTATRCSRGRRDGRRRWPGPTATLPPCPSRRAAGSGRPCRGFVSLHRDMSGRGSELAPGTAGRGAQARRRGPCSCAERLLLAHGLRADRSGVQPDVGLPVSRRRGALGTAHARAGRPEPPARARPRDRPDVAGQPGQYDAAVGGPAAQPKHRLGTPHSAARSRAPAPSAQWSSGPLRTYLTWRRAGRIRCLRWLRGRRLSGAIGVPRDAAWYSVSGGDAPGRGAGDPLPPGRGSEPRWVVVVGRAPLTDALRRRRRSDPGRHDGPPGAALVAGTGPGPGGRPPDVQRRGAHGGGRSPLQ